MSELGVITISPRIANHQELEETRQAFHSLLDSLDDLALYQPSANPAWTVGEVLIHLVMGLRVVNCKTRSVQLGFRATGLSAKLRERLNALIIRQTAQRTSCFSIAHKYDQAHARLLRTLHSMGDDEWQKSPCCARSSMEDQNSPLTIEGLFHSIPKHFASHAEEIRQRPLGLPVVLPRPTTQAWLRPLLWISLFSLAGGLLAWLVSRKEKRRKR
jgi:hypothetical protein